VKGCLKGLLPNARTFVNVVQHLRGFGRFEINKRDLGRQREDRILIPEEEILHEIENQPSLRVQNSDEEIRQNRGILNRVHLSWTRRAEACICIANDGKHFEQLF
jgi:hypothetical protein